jgi:threonine aldolase
VSGADCGRGEALLEHLKTRSVLATGPIGLRFVTHLDVDAAGIDTAIAAVREFFTL